MRRAGGHRRQMQMREVVAVMMVIESRVAGGGLAGVKEDQGPAARPGKDRLPVPDQSERLLHHQVLRPRRGIRLRRPEKSVSRSDFNSLCRPNGPPQQGLTGFGPRCFQRAPAGRFRVWGARSARKYHFHSYIRRCRTDPSPSQAATFLHSWAQLSHASPQALHSGTLGNFSHSFWQAVQMSACALASAGV